MRRPVLYAGLMLAVAVAAASVWSQNLQVQGKLLVNTEESTFMYDLTTKQRIKLNTGGDIRASFSPDGRQITYGRGEWRGKNVSIMNNDGTNPQKLCDRGGEDNVNWCTDGYIYWAEKTNAIYRVNVLTKVKETVWNSPNIQGYSGTEVEDFTTSNNGRFGSARSSGMVSYFNIQTKQLYNYGLGGCSGWISGSGTRLAHPYTCCIPFPAGAKSWLDVAAIESLTVTPTGRIEQGRPVITFLWPPNQPNGAEDYRFEDFRFAKNSDDYVVCRASGLNGSLGALIYKISTGQWMNIPVENYQAYGLWIGQLPVADTTNPQITLSKTALLFTAAKLSDTVQVSNSGKGTLTNVTATVSAGATWLGVVRSGQGNTQTLVLTATPGSLAAGTYTATVTVTGGGATNSAAVAVTFNVGVSLTAPSGLTAQTSGSNVTLTWTDNNSTESGTAIERGAGSGPFTEIKRVAANATTWTDSAVAAGSYQYRLRAFNASSYSGYSSPVQATITTAGTISLTYPGTGVSITTGSTMRIRWSAVGINAVILEMSTDGGVDWQSITTGSAVFSTDSLWGNYPWIIPGTIAGGVLLRISDYNNKPNNIISPEFTVTSSAAVYGRLKPGRVSTGITSLRVERNALVVGIRVPGASACAVPVAVDVVGLDGAILHRTHGLAGSGAEVSITVPRISSRACVVRARASGNVWFSNVIH